MKSDLLKSLALRAKNRMIHNANPTRNLGYCETFGNCRIKLIEEKDENDFFDKVKSLLAGDSCVENPIKRLMNEDKMSALDTRGKEKYLLETIERYLKCRKLIEEENESKLVY